MLQEWQRLREGYARYGLEPGTIYGRIAEEYGCHRNTVRRWLDPEFRATLAASSNAHYWSTKGTPTRENAKAKHRQYQHVSDHIDRYVSQVMKKESEPVTMGEVARRIAALTGHSFHIRTLDSLCADYKNRTGRALLVQVSSSPDTYRLA